MRRPALKPAGQRLVNRAKRDGKIWLSKRSSERRLADLLVEAGWLVRLRVETFAVYGVASIEAAEVRP